LSPSPPCIKQVQYTLLSDQICKKNQPLSDKFAGKQLSDLNDEPHPVCGYSLWVTMQAGNRGVPLYTVPVSVWIRGCGDQSACSTHRGVRPSPSTQRDGRAQPRRVVASLGQRKPRVNRVRLRNKSPELAAGDGQAIKVSRVPVNWIWCET